MHFTQDQLDTVVQNILQRMREKSTNILALHGDLGAGKTTLVGALAKELGVMEGIISPTFIIYRIYDIEYRIEKIGREQQTDTQNLKPGTFSRLVHIDAYRLAGEEDARKIRMQELFADPQNLVCIEWPEHVGGLLPANALHAYLTYTGEHERHITIGEVT